MFCAPGSLPGRARLTENLNFASLQSAKAAFDAAREARSFVDIHAWQFTPSAFRLMIADLYACRFLALREKAFLEGDVPEFYIVLSRVGAGCPIDRLALLERTIAEERQIAFTSDATDSNSGLADPATIAELETKLALAEKHTSLYAAHIAALTASRSWRFTAPVRWAGRVVRRCLITPKA